MLALLGKLIDPRGGGAEKALADIAHQVAAGKIRDALDLAVDRSLLLNDTRLADETMRLRHMMFTPTAPRPDWPPVFPDRFSRAGVPEIDASKLSGEALGSGIQHHGALIVRGLAKAPEISTLRASIDTAMKKASRFRGDKTSRGNSTWYLRCADTLDHYVNHARFFTEAGGEAILAGDSPRMFAALVDLYERSGVFDAVTGYLGERPALSLAKTVLRRVPAATGTNWHQDGAFLGADIRVVNTWIALTDCGEDAPGLDLVGQRLPKVLETGTNGAAFDWSVGPGTVTNEGLDKDIVSPRFAAGDAIMFDQLFLHRTGIRKGMTKSRYAIEAWMFAPSTFPAETYSLAV